MPDMKSGRLPGIGRPCSGEGTTGESKAESGNGQCPARLTLGGSHRTSGEERAKVSWGPAMRALNSKLGNGDCVLQVVDTDGFGSLWQQTVGWVGKGKRRDLLS